jgi:hypothetical protein
MSNRNSQKSEFRIGGGQWVSLDKNSHTSGQVLEIAVESGTRKASRHTIKEVGRYHVDGGTSLDGSGSNGRVIETYHVFQEGLVTRSQYQTGDVCTGFPKEQYVPLSQFVGFEARLDTTSGRPVLACSLDTAGFRKTFR